MELSEDGILNPTSPTKRKKKSTSLYNNFYACYLLQSTLPGYERNAYIGSTPNPVRRLRQHNGEIAGGAKRTISKRPWHMALLVYGFPSRFAALQFEWAWQYPHKSRHFKEIDSYAGKQCERYYKAKLGVLTDMLENPHWTRWPLALHIISNSVEQLLVPRIPIHFRVTLGSLSLLPSLSPQDTDLSKEYSETECIVCHKEIFIEETLTWLDCSRCGMLGHMICLSKTFLEAEENGSSAGSYEKKIIPIHGICPHCSCDLKWGSLISALKSRLSLSQSIV